LAIAIGSRVVVENPEHRERPAGGEGPRALLDQSEKPFGRAQLAAGSPWKVLALDSDPAVLWPTRLGLKNLTFQDRPLELLEATTAREGERLLAAHPDTAVLLLGVVMEEQDAGLQLVKRIRGELDNQLVRIILRTDRPGPAPAERVIIDYDINDCRQKSSLTPRALRTTVISSLRSYQALAEVERMNHHLEEQVQARTAQLRQALELLEEDGKAGKAVQGRLLPPALVDLGAYRCESRLVPSMFLSGDFLDYFPIDQDHLGFYLVDVAGHGAGSALVTVLVNSFFNRLVGDWREQGDRLIFDPARVLARLNGDLLAQELERHLTCFYGVLRQGDNRLLFAPGGQYPFPLLWHAGGHRVIETRGNALGLLHGADFHNQEELLPRGFKLGLFSDGMLEIMPGESDRDRMARLAGMESDTKAQVARTCREFCGPQRAFLPDDVTVLTISERGKDG